MAQKYSTMTPPRLSRIRSRWPADRGLPLKNNQEPKHPQFLLHMSCLGAEHVGTKTIPAQKDCAEHVQNLDVGKSYSSDVVLLREKSEEVVKTIILLGFPRKRRLSAEIDFSHFFLDCPCESNRKRARLSCDILERADFLDKTDVFHQSKLDGECDKCAQINDHPKNEGMLIGTHVPLADVYIDIDIAPEPDIITQDDHPLPPSYESNANTSEQANLKSESFVNQVYGTSENITSINANPFVSLADTFFPCSICFDPLPTDPSFLCSTTRRSASAIVSALQDAKDGLSASDSTCSFSPPVALTPCGHLFHAACIIKSMQHSFSLMQQPRCPLCRAALSGKQVLSKSAHHLAGWRVLVRAAWRGANRSATLRERCWAARLLLIVFAVYVALFVGLMVHFYSR